MSIPSHETEKENVQHEIQRLEGLFESSSLHYQSLDVSGNILRVNTAWLKTLGYEEADVLDTWFGEFLTDESKIRFRENYSNFLSSKKSRNMELTLICKDGSKIIADFSCIGNFHLEGKLFYSHCVFQNITKLRLTEQALEESEKKYSGLVELASVGILEFDVTSMKVTYLNQVIKQTLGISADTLDYTDAIKHLSPDSRAHLKQRLDRLLKGDHISKLAEYKVVTVSGKELWIQFSSTFLREEERVRIIGVAQNITDRKQLEIRLQEYHDRLEQLIGNLPAILFQFKVIRGNLKFIYVSENIQDYLGLDKAEILKESKAAIERIDQHALKDIRKTFHANTGQDLPRHLDFQVAGKNGTKRWIRTLLSPRELEDKTILWTGISDDITEELALKEKLSKTETLYKALVNSASPGISTMSPGGIVSSVNPRLLELSGYEEEELVGKHFLKIPAFYTKDAPRYLALYNDARKGKIPTHPVPFNWKHKSGKKRWGEGYLSSIVENGKVVGYQAVLADITSRVLHEDKEEQRKNAIDILFEAAVKLLNITDEKELYPFIADLLEKLNPGTYILVASVSEEQDSLTTEALRVPAKPVVRKVLQLLGDSIPGRKFEITPDTFSYSIAGRLRRYHNNIYDLAVRQVPKGICDQVEKLIDLGSIYEISLGTPEQTMGGCAIFLKNGQEIKHRGIIETLFREASSALVRLRTNKKLDASEKLYRSLAESSGEWILRFNKEYQHIYVNKSFGESLKNDPENFIGKRCVDLGYSLEHARLIDARLSETFSKKTHTECTLEMHMDGTSNFYEWRFYPEKSESGSVESVLVNARNITKRKELEGKLLDSIANKNKLYSIISHDLRTPFNSIIGFLNILKTRYDELSDEERLKYINIVDEASHNCLSLYDSILHWSEDNMEDEPIKPVYFDLGMLVEKVIDLNRASFLQKELRVCHSIGENVIVLADYNMIYAVLRNLVSNACKFSNTGDSIVISMEDKRNNVLCKIEDSGVGMDKEMIDRVLKNKKGTSRPGTLGTKGYGLGFKLARDFVEFNGGKIWVESVQGKGTSVFFTLRK
jgi:PAS domain S-box-containing protein